MDYKDAGVSVEKEDIAMSSFKDIIKEAVCSMDKYNIDNYFANIIGNSIAVSMDGVGTKLLLAQMLHKYDTIGIDCIAMNVNDLICIGAKPIAFLDYIAIENIDQKIMNDIAKGLVKGARLADVSIPGGEVAQIGSMLQGFRAGEGLDLVGTGIGLIQPNKAIIGDNIEDKDVVIGLNSSGLHSNGYSLVRKIVKDYSYIPEEIGISLGEELLTPTFIYTSVIRDIMKRKLPVKAFVNITGDGLLNLLRVKSNNIQIIIDNLPVTPFIFKYIQEVGRILDKDMFQTFNMGVGFCIVVSEEYAGLVKEISFLNGFKCWRIGYVEKSGVKCLDIPSKSLRGFKRKFFVK